MQKYTALVTHADPPLPSGVHDIYVAAEADERIAELEKALRDVKLFLEDPRWGTYHYMEGTDVYEDKDEALATITSVLMETATK